MVLIQIHYLYKFKNSIHVYCSSVLLIDYRRLGIFSIYSIFIKWLLTVFKNEFSNEVLK